MTVWMRVRAEVGVGVAVGVEGVGVAVGVGWLWRDLFDGCGGNDETVVQLGWGLGS